MGRDCLNQLLLAFNSLEFHISHVQLNFQSALTSHCLRS
jgi:hypothetical protein